MVWAMCVVVGKSDETICGPPKRVYLAGDVIIGGLIPVHASNPPKLNEPGIMWVEAMLFAIEEINRNRSLLPNLTLGYDIRDSCNQVDLALRAALDFLLSNVNETSSTYADEASYVNSSSRCLCNQNGNKTATSSPPVVAIVGGASSRISISVSPLFSVDNIPQISYSSTSPSLSEKSKYRSFLRTIPSDVHQAKAIASILEYFNWTYVSIVVSDDEYGRNGLIALRDLLKTKDICVAVEEMFATTSDSAEIVRKLQKYDRASVVVLWCERPEAVAFLQTASEGKLSNVTWIGTESWGDSPKVIENVDFDQIAGMIGVLPFLGRLPKFEEHLKKLTPKTVDTHVNPWLREYWSQDKFNACVANPNSCAEKHLPNAANLPPNKYGNVIDAVYAIALGLHSLMENSTNSTVDKKMFRKLISHVKKVEFGALSGKGAFMFTDSGDPEYGSYNIKNLQGNRTSNDFVTVAHWVGQKPVGERLRFLEKKKIQWNRGGITAPVPPSRCSDVCKPGFYYVPTSETCCWNCVRCQDGFFKNEVENTDCRPCPDGHVSNGNRTGCTQLEEDFLKWDSALSIVVLIFSFLGIVLVVFVVVVFVKYSRTAVVKASNRELSMIDLVCHGLIFLSSLLYIGRPRTATCLVRSYLFSILFTITTSIMFLKTDRIVRIFNSKSRLTKRSRLLSNKVQFVLAFVLVCIPVVGTTVWILLQPLTVTTERVTSGDDRFVVFCGPRGALTVHIIQLAYILLLALLCTYEAYKARRLPESFNEAKFICFSMFGFVLMWVGYIPGYMDTVGSTKQFITCLFSLLTNFTTLGLIYGPKLNIVLFQPQRNSHEAFRKATLNSCLQQVRRLSPVSTPDMPHVGAAIIANASPAVSAYDLNREDRTVSELTDTDSIGSRDPLVDSGPRLGPSPLTIHGLSMQPSSRPGNDFNDSSKPKEKVPSIIVRGQPLYRPNDSDSAPKIREAIVV